MSEANDIASFEVCRHPRNGKANHPLWRNSTLPIVQASPLHRVASKCIRETRTHLDAKKGKAKFYGSRGGIGRHARLWIWCQKWRASSRLVGYPKFGPVAQWESNELITRRRRFDSLLDHQIRYASLAQWESPGPISRRHRIVTYMRHQI